jgi:hypothetical protein
MSPTYSDPSTDGASPPERQRAADWLGLAATPTFAVMALLTAGFGGGAMERLCSAGPFPLGGMVIMYGLMSLFHSPPWLRLISGRRVAPA